MLEQILKSSEGAKKAWLTRQRNKAAATGGGSSVSTPAMDKALADQLPKSGPRAGTLTARGPAKEKPSAPSNATPEKGTAMLARGIHKNLSQYGTKTSKGYSVSGSRHSDLISRLNTDYDRGSRGGEWNDTQHKISVSRGAGDTYNVSVALRGLGVKKSEVYRLGSFEAAMGV